MRRCATSNQMGNKINSLIFRNRMGDNARHRIAVNRTIDGMCLDGGWWRPDAESQGERAADQVRPQALPRRRWPPFVCRASAN